MRQIKSSSSSASEESEFVEDDSDLEPEKDASINSSSISRRGRKKIPEKWTRVEIITPNHPSEFSVFDLAPDLLLSRGLPHLGESLRLRHWSIFFCQKDFISRHEQLTFDKFRLSSEQLRKYGVKVTKIRKTLLD